MTRKARNEILIEPVLNYLGIDTSKTSVICPFHADTRASASWYPYYFKCHACDASGDAVGLLHRNGGLTFAEAYELAASLSGGGDAAKPIPREPGRRVPAGTRVHAGHHRSSKARSGR